MSIGRNYARQQIKRAPENVVSAYKKAKKSQREYFLPFHYEDESITDWCGQYQKIMLQGKRGDLFAPYEEAELERLKNKGLSLKLFMLPEAVTQYEEIIETDLESLLWFESTTGFTLSYNIYYTFLSKLCEIWTLDINSDTVKMILKVILDVIEDIAWISVDEIGAAVGKFIVSFLIQPLDTYAPIAEEALERRLEVCREIIEVVTKFLNHADIYAYYELLWFDIVYSEHKGEHIEYPVVRNNILNELREVIEKSWVHPAIREEIQSFSLRVWYYENRMVFPYDAPVGDETPEEWHSKHWGEYHLPKCFDEEVTNVYRLHKAHELKTVPKSWGNVFISKINHNLLSAKSKDEEDRFFREWNAKKKPVYTGALSADQIYALIHNKVIYECLNNIQKYKT